MLLWCHPETCKESIFDHRGYWVPGILHLLSIIIVLLSVYRGAVFYRIFLQEMVCLDPVNTGLILIIHGITFIPLVWLIGSYTQLWQ